MSLDLDQLGRLVSILEHAGPTLTRADIALRTVAPELVEVARTLNGAWDADTAHGEGSEESQSAWADVTDARAALDAKLAEWKS